MGTLQVKDWAIFQHYKDRNPPWIKLQTNLFQNYEFSRLQDASKLLALCIWTLAARSKDGSVPHDLAWIKGQCGLGDIVTQSNLKELISMGYLIASDVLADCKRSAIPETETERETDILFTDVNNIKTKSEKLKKPDEVAQDTWDDFVKHRKAKKAPVTETVIKSIKREADKIGWPLDKALAEVCARGWQGFKAEWINQNLKGNQNATSHHNLTKSQRADIALGIINTGTDERVDGSITVTASPVLRQFTEIR